MEIINSVFSWIIKKRIHQMELFMKYPMDVQNELLLGLLHTARNTEWGKRYDYASITSYEEFKNRIPLQSYETLVSDIIRIKQGEQNVLWPSEIKWFAKSSGTTTGKSKFIPVSKESLIDCHYKGGKDLLAIYHNNHPASKLILGKVLVVGGSSEINSFNNKSYYGDLSAIIMKNFPLWVEQRRVPKLSIAIMDDWEKKIDMMVDATVNENVSNISGVPSWTLYLMQRMLDKHKADNILDIWPNLELYMHGGINFSPYKEQFKQLIPSSNMNYYENYNASEGFFGLQDQSGVEEMLLMLDYGIFYEFVPMDQIKESNPRTLTLDQVEKGKNYAVVISTNAGLWRYMIGDTVKFTSLSPYRIQVTGRVKHYINAFGEELIIENAERALSNACARTNACVKDFTVAPKYMEANESGKHEWLVEFDRMPKDMNEFVNILDDSLQQENSDYQAKRAYDMILKQPEVHPLENGTFYKWMKSNTKLGGQHKVPRLSNDRTYVEELLKLVQ